MRAHEKKVAVGRAEHTINRRSHQKLQWSTRCLAMLLVHKGILLAKNAGSP